MDSPTLALAGALMGVLLFLTGAAAYAIGAWRWRPRIERGVIIFLKPGRDGKFGCQVGHRTRTHFHVDFVLDVGLRAASSEDVLQRARKYFPRAEVRIDRAE